MKKKNSINLASEIYNFQKKILHQKPPLEKMYEEIRMMKFKIRPLQGDISELNFLNKEFIEILWNLGKLDEFFHRERKKLNEKQKEVFLNFFDHLYDKFQSQLNKIELRGEKEDKKSEIIEMEIYKEDPIQRKSN